MTYANVQQIDIIYCPIKPRVDDGHSATKGQDSEDIVTLQIEGSESLDTISIKFGRLGRRVKSLQESVSFGLRLDGNGSVYYYNRLYPVDSMISLFTGLRSWGIQLARAMRMSRRAVRFSPSKMRCSISSGKQKTNDGLCCIEVGCRSAQGNEVQQTELNRRTTSARGR